MRGLFEISRHEPHLPTLQNKVKGIENYLKPNIESKDYTLTTIRLLKSGSELATSLTLSLWFTIIRITVAVFLSFTGAFVSCPKS